MPPRRKLSFLAFLLAALCAAPALALPSVTILADPSMGAAIAEIARIYSREHNVVANTAFTSSAQQEQEITEGGSADVLITPKPAWIEQLKTQGLVDVYSQVAVARNRIALVGPAESALQMRPDGGFPTLKLIREMAGEQLFVVGNPETLLEGVYGREVLRNLDIAGDLEPYTLYIKHLDQMYGMVRNQWAYGIFFYSSAMHTQGVRVVGLLPENTHRPIEYYAVAIAGENMAEARKFIDYLVNSASARKLLRDNGFNAS